MPFKVKTLMINLLAERPTAQPDAAVLLAETVPGYPVCCHNITPLDCFRQSTADMYPPLTNLLPSPDAALLRDMQLESQADTEPDARRYSARTLPLAVLEPLTVLQRKLAHLQAEHEARLKTQEAGAVDARRDVVCHQP